MLACCGRLRAAPQVQDPEAPAPGAIQAGSQPGGVPKADEDLATLRRLTAAQEAAASAAAAAQEARVAALREVQQLENDKAEERKHEWGGDKAEKWKEAGGERIDKLLQHTPLVDLEWVIDLIERGGAMPRRQEVPAAALITPESAWRLGVFSPLPVHVPSFRDCPSVVVLSYPWLDFYHPDRQGEQLRRLLPIFRALLSMVRSDGLAFQTAGLLMDWPCLFQKPFACEEEKKAFGVSLSNINEWYYHPFTTVLLVTTPAPEGDYLNTLLHEKRGWCEFEKCASAVVKDNNCLLDVARYAGATDWPECVEQMRAQRPPPRSPDTFSAQMRARVDSGDLKFTAGADMETVIEQYRKGFVAAWEQFLAVPGRYRCLTDTVEYTGLGWDDEAFAVLVEALEYAAEHCSFHHGRICISVSRGNSLVKFGDYTAHWTEKSLKQQKIEELNAKWEGKFELV